MEWLLAIGTVFAVIYGLGRLVEWRRGWAWDPSPDKMAEWIEELLADKLDDYEINHLLSRSIKDPGLDRIRQRVAQLLKDSSQPLQWSSDDAEAEIREYISELRQGKIPDVRLLGESADNADA